LSWGIFVGAKLYDLIVPSGAWASDPPGTLAISPYGFRYPVNPGDFFRPSAGLIVLTSVGALASGWNTPFAYRRWLILSFVLIVVVWVFTLASFWPRNDQPFLAAHGKIDAVDASRIAHEWIRYDWLRVSMMGAGFIAAVRALSLPYPPRSETKR
jgi:hypothetical protein